ncbi:MAG TPA: Asp-tRNA(Asn)/Glu-tRNA(Gln) amidotransferase subunit GatC [Armatimonadota bacterium]|nr:Asp-tRNA(Asn)/Glu-tRNA(Gln) amidotransferase subunit GatC [Armatimonadota bacterium]
MRLSREEVEHVALLSRLKLSEDEVGRFTEQLNSILGYFEQLQEADTSQASGTTHVVPMVNVMREDIERPSFEPDETLSNAPERMAELFKVPRVVE